MKIEIYGRESALDPVGIYISGDLTGDIPQKLVYRAFNGKVYEMGVPGEVEAAIHKLVEMVKRKV